MVARNQAKNLVPDLDETGIQSGMSQEKGDCDTECPLLSRHGALTCDCPKGEARLPAGWRNEEG